MPVIVAAIFAWFARIMATRIGMWAVSALVFLGLTFTTQSLVMGPTINAIQSYANGAGDAATWMAYLNFDKAITMVCSAWLTKLTAQGAKAVLSRRTT